MSRITTFAPGALACRTAAWQRATGSLAVKIGVDRQAELLAEHLQLLDGGGTLQVGGHQQRLAAARL